MVADYNAESFKATTDFTDYTDWGGSSKSVVSARPGCAEQAGV